MADELAPYKEPKKHKHRRSGRPKLKPRDYWVRWLPQCQGPITAWYEVMALEKNDGTHRVIHTGIDPTDQKHWLGQMGDSRYDFPSDVELLKMENPQHFLRERIYAEWQRAKNFIDYVLKQHGIIPDENWKWIMPKARYFVMTDAPPFPAEGFHGGRYVGLRAPASENKFDLGKLLTKGS